MTGVLAWPWEKQESGRLNSVQALRGIAVLLVVIYHAKVAIPDATFLHLPIVDDFGWIGVRLFFTISGFIIADRISLAGSLGEFYLRRYLRVFPLYALATLVAVYLAYLFGGPMYSAPVTETGAAYEPGPFYLLKSLFIVPQNAWPYLSVGWSLEYELAFYAIFGAMHFILGPRVAMAVFIPLGFWIWYSYGLGLFYNAGFAIYFSCGVAARLGLSLKLAPIWPAFVMVLGLGYTVYEMEFTGIDHYFLLSSGIGCLGLLMLVVQLEKQHGWFQHRSFLVWCGDISFSLYLVHQLFIISAYFPFRPVELTPIQADGLRFMFVFVSLGLGYLTWAYVERPLRFVEHAVARKFADWQTSRQT